MHNKNHIWVNTEGNVTTIKFQKHLLQRADAGDLVEDVATDTVTLTINRRSITYEQAGDLCSIVDILAREQAQKVTAMDRNIQNARNKATELSLLTQELMGIFDSLAPSQRIYHTSNPNIFMDLPREIAIDQVNAEGSYWSFKQEKVSELLKQAQ